MNATCPSCGKVLKVKDEWAGKTLKCPGCAHAFKIGGALSPAQAVANLGKKPQPAAAARPGPPVRAPRAEQKAGVAINWGPIVLIAGAALLVLGVLLFVMGPMRVKGKWDEVHQQARDDVSAIVEHALKAEASQSGMWNPRRARGMPTINDLNFHPDLMAMSLPDTVRFVGTTSNGKFEGDYTFSTGRVVGTLTIGGITLGGVHIDAEGVTLPGGQTERAPSGMPMRGSANVTYQLTGQVKDDVVVTCELDGKKAVIITPPELDEDGNPVTDRRPSIDPRAIYRQPHPFAELASESDITPGRSACEGPEKGDSCLRSSSFVSAVIGSSSASTATG